MITEFRLFVLNQPRCICQEGGWMCDRCDRIVQEHERIVKELQNRYDKLSWKVSPDRSGGAFDDYEKDPDYYEMGH